MNEATVLYQNNQVFCNNLAIQIHNGYVPKWDSMAFDIAKRTIIDSIRKWPNKNQYAIYFKDSSVLLFFHYQCEPCGMSRDLKQLYEHTEYTEIIWAAEEMAVDFSCMNCMYRGAIFEACPEHGEL